MLAEGQGVDNNDLVSQLPLNFKEAKTMRLSYQQNEIKIFHKLGDALSISIIDPETRFVGCEIKLASGNKVMLVCVHLASQIYTDEDKRYKKARKAIQRINNEKETKGIKDLIICGDFNMNPYEKAMICPDGFNATICKVQANKITRISDGDIIDFLFNPCLSLYGSNNNSAKGTYYYDKTKDKNLFWHMLDQVVFTPQLMESFDFNSLKIIERVNNEDLVSEIEIKKSDHLPIVFSFNF